MTFVSIVSPLYPLWALKAYICGTLMAHIYCRKSIGRVDKS